MSRRVIPIAAALLAAACTSTPEDRDESKPDDLVRIQLGEPEAIGALLLQLDSTIQQWSLLSLTAKSPAERRQARVLEAVLVETASKRRDDLIRELESGPPLNRIRAAAALGFTRAVEAQSPLLAALSDPHPDVVHNALLGLAVLGRGDTPVDDVCRILERSEDAQTRSQAAWALRSIVGAGGGGDVALGAARRGLIDPEPFVRAQCALVLGLLGDGDSYAALADALYDEAPLVSQAASESLPLIAKAVPERKGDIARALVEAYARDDAALKARARRAMASIADVDYGEELTPWAEWARRLP
jgi:HEAT repeat protein